MSAMDQTKSIPTFRWTHDHVATIHRRMSEVSSAYGGDLQLVVLEKVDRTTNALRFYVLSIEPTLFCEWSLVRGWGRIGAAERRRIELYQTERAARVELETWLARKQRRGYAVCPRPLPPQLDPTAA
jgi:predicted DNA-binding WGR domain protein